MDNIIHRHNEFLRDNNIRTNFSSMQLLGCNKKQFINYIIQKLKDVIVLENYGEW